MRTILVINSKGGSGKTTLTTNLASYFASQKIRTAIMDCDPQGSSLQWLKQRPGNLEPIHGANAAPTNKAAPLNSIKAWIPTNIETLIIDAPAGIKGIGLQDIVRRSNFIVIPVSPSAIDIHATADFVKDLFLTGGARSSTAKIAVVANRVRSTSPGYEPLVRFLTALKLPFLTKISDSDNYLHAVEKGVGIFEMDESSTQAERLELMPLFRWLDGHDVVPIVHSCNVTDKVASIESSNKVVSIESSGKFAGLRLSGRALISTLLNATGRFKKHP